MTGRRAFLKTVLAGASLLAAPWVRGKTAPHVVVVGGGFGGATAAKYLRQWSRGQVAVTLVERNRQLVSCPLSNRVLSGDARLADLSFSYGELSRRWGVRVIHDEVVGLDAQTLTIRLARGSALQADRLLLSPGIDFLWDSLPALGAPAARDALLHAWKAGPQTGLLARQIKALPDGATFAITIPRPPYRCPPGPYERVSLVADYFRRHKPRSKVLVVDANPEIIAKGSLFRAAWAELYPGQIEYLPEHALDDIDFTRKELRTRFGPLRADLLNVIPDQRAGQLALDGHLPLVDKRWVGIDWLTHEAQGVPGLHVIGDAVQSVPGMPKSAHMANQQAKRAAAAILDLLEMRAPRPASMLGNTCYSFVSAESAIHVTAMFRYEESSRSMRAVEGSGGVSVTHSAHESKLAHTWAKGLWTDALG